MFTRLLSVILVVFCITAVSAQKSSKRAKNVILMIGDGMGAAQVYAGLTANKGKLNLERCTAFGFHKNQSADNYITDSAAGATAFACGQKTYNGAIGVGPDRTPIPSILEIAEKNGLATGLIATCAITEATPACFIAHQPARTMNEEIAMDFMKTDIDLFIGGGRKYFTQRKDGKNLIDSLKSREYQVTSSIEEASKAKQGNLAVFLAEEQQPKFSEGRGDQLVKSVELALNTLPKKGKGVFMMIEGSQIDWGGHANDTQYIVNEMIDFDNAIGKVLDFAQRDGNTLVIITADHETGGFSLVDGNMKTGMVEGKFTTTHHTGVMIPVFAYGPGAEKFSGIYENNTIFNKMLDAFAWKTR